MLGAESEVYQRRKPYIACREIGVLLVETKRSESTGNRIKKLFDSGRIVMTYLSDTKL